MNRLSVELGARLWPVAHTLAAPAICYRTEPVRVTVVGFGLGDLVEVTEPDGKPHTIHATDLSRVRPTARMQTGRPMARTHAQTDAQTSVLWEETTLF